MADSNSPHADPALKASHPPGERSERSCRPIKFLWFLGVPLALLQSILYMHVVSPDAISYLDLAEFIARGEWHLAVNGYWNPLYPTLLALVLLINPFGPAAEAALAHLVNFFVFVLLCWVFAHFLRQINYHFRSKGLAEPPPIAMELAVWLFLWSTLQMITLRHLVPDLLVACSFLGAATLLMKLINGSGTWKTSIAMGITLALGYFSKAIMFPIGLLFCAMVPFSARKSQLRLAHTAAVTATFLSISALYIIPLSEKYGKPTFSESGRLAHAWMVNGLPTWFHWQGHEPGSGTPEHPTRRIQDQPPVYEFARAEGGTYPPWFDPAYWHQGLEAQFFPVKQLKALIKNLDLYYEWVSGTPIFLVILLFFGASLIQTRKLATWGFSLPLLVPPVLGLFAYTLIYTEPRYTAPFWLVIFMILLVQTRKTALHGALRTAALAICIGHFAVMQLEILSLGAVDLTRKGHIHYEVAQELAERGLSPGENLAVIGTASHAYFARLADVQIVAEAPTLPGTPPAPLGDEETRELIQLLSTTSAQAIVTSIPPAYLPGAAWEQLSDTGFYFLPLEEQSPLSSE